MSHDVFKKEEEMIEYFVLSAGVFLVLFSVICLFKKLETIRQVIVILVVLYIGIILSISTLPYLMGGR